jgi:hypothetical protein
LLSRRIQKGNIIRLPDRSLKFGRTQLALTI